MTLTEIGSGGTVNADITLTGYDRTTEILTTFAVVPPHRVLAARTVAHVPASDPGIVGVYPLQPEEAASIAALASTTIDLDRYDYCIEAIARETTPMTGAAASR